MRILLWSLLALNGLAALLWAVGFTVPATSRSAAPPPTLTAQRLELLSELPSPPARLDAQPEAPPPSLALADAAPAEPAADAPAGEVASAPTPEALSPPPADAGDGAPVAEPAPPSRSDATAAPPVTEQAPAPTAAQPAPAKPAPDAVSGAQAANAADASAAVVATDTPAAPDGPGCFRTAAFAPDAQPRVEAALREAGFASALVKSSLRPRHWVYWSGPASAAAGVEQALKAAGVRDWYRVGGAREATISLGVYGQADGARRRQQQLAANGIEAKVSERYAAQARLRWQVSAAPAAVESAQAGLQRQGVGLEACP